MGKGQRTKGNTRPANSLRSAQLLSSTLGSAPINTFIGFDALKEQSETPSTIGSSNVGSLPEEEEVDADFKLIVKQMYKKDSITKIKALQKFAEYCDEKEYTSVKSVLSMWPRVFNKLAIDNDFRVRETTFQAHEALAKKLGKNIAPILKQIIAIWIISLHDTYAVSASAAKSSFAASFSPAKQAEVLVFCKEEIVNYCRDILLVQNVATIDDPSSVSTLDRETKYHRLVSCSLQALTLLITSLSQPETIKDHIEKLIDHDNFWKLAKLEDINVKINWYRLKSTICDKYPSIVTSNETKFVSSTLLHIAEKDPLLSAAIWDNVLWILVTIEEWWKHINLQKGFFPHLRKFIREGGFGNAATIFPNLLPMLSKFPFDHLENSAKFCEDFMESFETCILNQNYSSKEYTCIVKSYFECIQYLLVDRKSDKSLEKLDSSICERTISCVNQILSKWSDIYGLFLREMTLFITNCKDPNVSDNLVKSVEEKILNVIEEAVADENKLGLLTKALASILRVSSDKSLRRVKFQEEEEDEIPVSEVKVKVNGTIFKSTLQKTWERTLELSNTREESTSWLNCLKSIQELCLTINKETGSEFIVHNYLDQLKSLLQAQISFTSKSTQKTNIKNLIGMMLNCCDSSATNQSEILSYLSSHPEPVIMVNLFELLPLRIEKDSSLRRWFTTPEIGQLFTSIMSNILQDLKEFKPGTESSWVSSPGIDFIGFAFKIDDIHFPTINSIASMLTDALDDCQTDGQTFKIVEMIRALFVTYPLAAQLDSTTILMKKVTSLTLDLKVSPDQLSAYKSTLIAGLKTIMDHNDETQLNELLNDLASLIKSSIINGEKDSWDKSERLDSITGLFISGLKDLPMIKSDYPIHFCESLIPGPEYLTGRTQHFGLNVFYPLWIQGKVVIPSGVSSPSNVYCLHEQFIFTMITITKILNLIPEPNPLINQQLPFACFALANLELVPQDLDLPDKEAVHSQLNEFVTKRIENLTRDEMVHLFKTLVNVEATGAIALVLGLRPILSLSAKLNPINNHWNLEDYEAASITIFQLVSQYFDSDEIISLSQETLRYLLNQDDPDRLQSCYKHLSVLNTCLNHEQIKFPPYDLVRPIMDHLLALKEKAEQAMLLECSMDNQPEEAILFTIEIIKLYKTIITKYHKDLTQEQKDLIIISVTAWSISLSSSDPKSFESNVKMTFLCTFCNLFLSIALAIEIEGDSFSSVREWTDFHLIRISSSLVPLLFQLNDYNFSGYQLNFISLLGKTISSLTVFDVASLKSDLERFTFPEGKTITEDDVKAVICPLPNEYEILFTKLNHLFVNRYSAFYLCAHYFTQRLIPMMVSSCSVFDSTFDYLAPPKPFLAKLQETDLIVDTLLSDYSLGTTCCLIKPGTDSFCYTIAYLLNWFQILTFFSQLNDENRSSLAGFLTDSNYISNLLDNLFKLMPIAVDDQISENINFIGDVLTSDLLDSLDENSHIQALSCLVYFHILRKMPACVRMWLSKLDKKTSDLVNRFTVATMSELIRTEEFQAIQNANSDRFKNIQVKARHSAREVVAIYAIEDMSIELTIKLADNHPLTPVTIDGGRRVGVSVPEWRNLLLQVTSFLTHQNGTVLDGLILWNRNMCKRFEGLEECVICYFILHGSNCQVPKLTCRNCRKKFHSACLYKWFEKSNQSSCPLCRNPFVFHKSGNTLSSSSSQQQAF